MEIKVVALKEAKGKINIYDGQEWFNEFSFKGKIKKGDIVYLDKKKKKIISLQELEKIKDKEQIDTKIEDDVRFALDVFREVFERDPIREEFILINKLIDLRNGNTK